MLSYQHGFHAGNFADVLKHLVLSNVLRYMTEKDAPLAYIDTHAGAGGYSLSGQQAAKTGEFKDGIGRLWGLPGLPQELQHYLELVQRFNSQAHYGQANQEFKSAGESRLRAYPGSPWLAGELLRPTDRLSLCELHPSDFPKLESLMTAKNTRCFFEDGFNKSKALVPPPEKRGLVLIDPSYEIKSDYERVVEHTLELYRRFATGVFAIWYPIIDGSRAKQLLHNFKRSGLRRVQVYELFVSSDVGYPGMQGAGMVVINPPWMLKQQMQTNLAFLADIYAASSACASSSLYRVATLVDE